jgi:hypothetical protein
MGNVNKALSKDAGTATIHIGPLHPSAARIYQRITNNFEHIKTMLTGDKAEEYGNPQTMCRRIGRRWFEREDGETDVAIMMAELKIERIKFDPTKEDSYMDAIAYLAMALAFMQERKNND